MNKEKLKKKLEVIKAKYKGQGGGPESESYVHDAKCDRDDGCVYVSTDNKLAAKIAERCGDNIIDVVYNGYGMVEFKIDRKGFRGIEYAFKVSSGKKRPDPVWLRNKSKKKS